MAFGRRKKQEAQGAEELFTDAPQEAGRERLTPVEVQQKVFRLAFRGYNERDVDEFLDQVTEELAALHEENKRMREELELRGPGGGTEEARRHAEEIIRRAREEAARMTAGAATAGAAAGAAASPSYLVREREFLQRLAGLVQGHAETLKAEARRARAAAEAPEEEVEVEASEAESQPPEPPEQAPHPPAPDEPQAPAEEAPEPAAEAAPPPPEPPMERTAPMQQEAGEGELSEWANPFADLEGGAGEGFADEDSDEEEPSLRELFWGEE